MNHRHFMLRTEKQKNKNNRRQRSEYSRFTFPLFFVLISHEEISQREFYCTGFGCFCFKTIVLNKRYRCLFRSVDFSFDVFKFFFSIDQLFSVLTFNCPIKFKQRSEIQKNYRVVQKYNNLD